MKPDIWGKHLWYSIHFIALAFPDDPTNEEKRNYQSFFENLHKVLPCHKCSLNYVEHLIEKPITFAELSNSETLFRWTVDIHNLVNKETSKDQWTYETASAFYGNFKESVKTKKCDHMKIVKISTVVAFSLLAVIAIQMILRKKRK